MSTRKSRQPHIEVEEQQLQIIEENYEEAQHEFGEQIEEYKQSPQKQIKPIKVPIKFHLAPKSDIRLIVKEIVFENFKSYQGRQVIGPFHKRFTSVVGPNGSGKSNLIESLLFVFGKKASWMRLKTLNQLIHNSSQHQEIKKACVEVVFHDIRDQEGEEFEIIPNSEFSIRRTVNQQSVSKYEINNRESTQQEVIDVLKAKGIDLQNNRFLILQGEVEQISLMKPMSGDSDKPGLLEYLEDIIGSDQFKEEIEKKDEEHENLQNEKREKGERMRIHEIDLEKLNEAKNLAVEYIKNEKQKYQIINIMSQIEQFRCKKEGEKFEGKKKELQQKNTDMKQQYKQKMKENEDLLLEYKKSKQDMQNKEFEIKKLDGEFKKLTDRDEQIRQKLLLETEKQTKLEKQIIDLQKEYNKIVRDSKEYEKELPLQKEDLKKLEQEKDKSEKILTDLKNKLNNENQKLVQQKKDAEKKLYPIKDQQNDIKLKKDTLENKLKLLTVDLSQIENEIKKTNQEKTRTEQQLNENKVILERSTIALDTINKKKHQEQNLLAELKNFEQKIIKSMEECKQRIDQFNQSHQENTSRNKVLTELIHAQKQGKLNGIIGRLGDLATISEQYDISITTACPQLDNILVERYEDAQAAVQFLRTEKIGVASFIALDKIEHNRNEMDRQFIPPSNSQRLFDLLVVKEQRLRVAFYFALRNTLLCEDIDQATLIAYGKQRHRVVTLKGELIESSGVMSGGGNPRKGGMANKLRQEISHQDLIRFQEEYQRNQCDLKQLREKISQCQNTIMQYEQDLKYVQKEVENKKFDQKLNEDQLEMNQKKLSALAKQSQPAQNNEKEKEKIQQDLQEYSEQYLNITNQINIQAQFIQEIEEKINSIGGNEYKMQIQNFNDLKQKFTSLQNQVFQIEARLNDTEKNLDKNQKQKLESQASLEKIVIFVNQYKTQQSEIEAKAELVLGEREKFEKELQILKQKHEDNNQFKIKLQQLLDEVKNNVEKLQKEIEEIDIKLNKIQDENSKTQLQMQQNRARYFDIISQYNFLDCLEEISNYQIGQEEISKKQADVSLIEQTILFDNKNQMQEEKEEEDKQEKHQLDRRHSSSKNILQLILQTEVNQNIKEEHLEGMEKYKEELKVQKANAEERLKKLENEANINTISEFKDKYLEFKARKEEFDRVKSRIQELKQDVDQLKKERFEKFMSGFNLISSKLKETYQTLTNGGDAELELIDSLDPFSDGVNFTVRPPKKSWKQISKLSGGEKTLSSLSLVFALHYYKPTPLYFMDEIDAALDFKNVSIVANYIFERTKNAQFIIISLRNNMFELANKLIGVYKTFDTTKTISIIPELIMQRISQINKENENKNLNLE